MRAPSADPHNAQTPMNTATPIDQPAIQSARIGQRLRNERKRLKLTQAALIQKLGISKGTAVNYEAGKCSPDAAQLAKLAVIGFDVNFVVTGTSQRSTPTAQAPSPAQPGQDPFGHAKTPLSPRMVHHLRLALVQTIGTKNKAKTPADRDALSRVIAQIAAELGISYQP